MRRRFCFAAVFAGVGVAVAASSPAHAGPFKPITTASAAETIYPLGTFDSRLIYSHVKGTTADDVRITDGVGDVLLTSVGAALPIRANGGLGIVGGKFLFAQYGKDLWATGGTPSTTTKISGTASPDLDLRASFAVVTPSLAWFSKPTYINSLKTNGFDIWKTDGTTAGTKYVTQLVCEDGDSPGFVQLGNQTLISVTPDPYVKINSGLWISDGTTTTQLAAAADGWAQRCGSYAFFFNKAEPAGWWRTDGTLAGTVPVSATSHPSSGYCIGSTFLIAEYTVRLRATTGGPPVEIGDDGTKGAVTPGDRTGFTSAGGFAYFTTTSIAPAMRTLYRTDGTSAGTISLVQTQDNGWQYGQIVALPNGRIVTSDGNVVVSDGTVAGTVRTSTALSSIGQAISVGAKTYFWAKDSSHGTEPWETDGTVAGTKLLDDVRPGPDGSQTSSPSQSGIYSADGQLFVVADDGVGGAQLMAARVAPSSRSDAGVGPGSESSDGGAAPGIGDGDDASAPPPAPPSESAATQDGSTSCASSAVRPSSSSAVLLQLLMMLSGVLLHRRRRARRQSARVEANEPRFGSAPTAFDASKPDTSPSATRRARKRGVSRAVRAIRRSQRGVRVPLS